MLKICSQVNINYRQTIIIVSIYNNKTIKFQFFILISINHNVNMSKVVNQIVACSQQMAKIKIVLTSTLQKYMLTINNNLPNATHSRLSQNHLLNIKNISFMIYQYLNHIINCMPIILLIYLSISNKMTSKLKCKNDHYDPFQSPPQLITAIKHRKATMVGLPTNQQPKNMCPCCFELVDKIQLDLRCHLNELIFLGTAVVGYFKLIKLAAIILDVLLVLSILSIIVSLQKQSILDYSTPLLLKQFLIGHNVLHAKALIVNTSETIFLTLLIYFFKRFYERQIYSIQKNTHSPSHFAIKISGLPHCDQKQLRQSFREEFGHTPVSIHLIYDTTQLKRAFEERQYMTVEMRKQQIKMGQKKGSRETVLQQKLIENATSHFQDCILRLDKTINKYSYQDKIISERQTDVAFAIFETVQIAKKIISKHQASQKEEGSMKHLFTLKHKNIIFEKAPCPRDIIWENVQNIHLNSYPSFIVLGILLAISSIYGISLLLKLVLPSIQPYDEDYLIVVLLFFVSRCLFKLIMGLFVEFIVTLRRSSTHTDKQLTYFYCHSFCSIVYSCSLPFAVVDQNYSYLRIYTNIILLVDPLIHMIVKLFSFTDIYKKIHSQYINHLHPDLNPFTQNYFNRLMEGINFKFGQNYQFILRGVIVSVFFASISSLGFIIYNIFFTLQYWMGKYLLLRKCKTPPKCSRKIGDHFSHILTYLPAVYLAGIMICKVQMKNQITTEMILVFFLQLIFSTLMVIYFIRHSMLYEPVQIYTKEQKLFDEYYQLQNDINKYRVDWLHLSNIYNNKMILNLNLSRKQTLQFNDIEMLVSSIDQKSQNSDEERTRIINKLLSYGDSQSQKNSYRHSKKYNQILNQ